MAEVIVAVAPTGGTASEARNPNLPTRPEEIAESVHASWKAGAATAALHARRPDDEATWNAELDRDVDARIRARCDIVLASPGEARGVLGLPAR